MATFSFGSSNGIRGVAGAPTFGAPAASAAPTQSQPAPFSFGAASGSSPFGATAAAPATNNMFGSQPGTNAFGSSTFGAAPAATSQPFSFSTPAQANAGTGGSGSSNAFGANTNAFGASTNAFGASTNQFGSASNAFGTGSTFGTGGNAFGASTNPFGSSQPAPAFGASTSFGSQSTLGQPAFGQQSQPAASTSQQPQPAGPLIAEKLQALQAAWDPQSPICRFQSYFYNVVAPNQAALYAKPQMMRDQLYQRAKDANPDPDRLVIALSTSFDDIKKRVDAQTQMANMHFAKLNELIAEIKKRSTERIEPALMRLQRASVAQVQLAGRLRALIAQLHPFTTRRLTPLEPTEDKLIADITNLHSSFTNGPNKLPVILNELWVQVSSRKAAAQLHANNGLTEAWGVTNEEELMKLLEVVDQQQKGLDFLTQILLGDLEALNIIRSGFGLPKV